MFSGKNAQFDKLLDKGANQYLLEPDWGANMAICDSIRQADVTPKYAVQSLRKKIANDNPHVASFAIQILETCVKNCGTSMHDEVCTHDFMQFLQDQLQCHSESVKEKILEIIRIWSHAFRNQAKYKIVTEVYLQLKNEGYKFPPLRESDAMFTSESAPDWKDGEKCHRCKTQFSTFRRKHHCRSCGNIFCNDCTTKRSIIPRFGIEREVRVCDSCYDQIHKIGGSDGGSKTDKDGMDLPAEYLNSALAKEPQTGKFRVPDRDRQKELELQEKEELDLALALSASEAEAKPTVRKTTPAAAPAPHPAPTPRNFSQLDTSEMDPELARYLNRNYWEKKSALNAMEPPSPSPSVASSIAQQPSAPPATFSPDGSTLGSEAGSMAPTSNGAVPFGVTEDSERQQEDFLNALRSSIDIFVNRMRSNSIRGRSIANDSSVQTLFLTLNAMHPQLLHFITQQEEARTYFETLQDKLAQMKDAREALNALREEHSERRRREAEEVARQRQIQMRQKLEVMRQKKQELLEYQRQLALQRLHEQEMERQMRLEQEKQMLQMRQYQQQFPYTYAQQQQHQQPPPQQQQPGMYAPQQQPYQPGPQAMGTYPPNMYASQTRPFRLVDVPGAPVVSGQPPMGAQPTEQYALPSMPPQGPQQAPPSGYSMPAAPPQGPVDYGQGPYNMQGMAQTLPDYGTPGGAPQPMMGAPYGAPYGGAPVQPAMTQQPAPAPPQQGPPGRRDDQLINFD